MKKRNIVVLYEDGYLYVSTITYACMLAETCVEKGANNCVYNHSHQVCVCKLFDVLPCELPVLGVIWMASKVQSHVAVSISSI